MLHLEKTEELNESIDYRRSSRSRPWRAPGLAFAQSPAGAATGAAVGGLSGLNRTRFRDYAIREHRAHSYRYSEPLRADVVLPEAGVTYYDVPPEYSVRDYRYTVVNETPVLVEPRKRRVIEVIE